MYIKQIQFLNCTDEEYDKIPSFLEFLINQIIVKLDSVNNRKKIDIRLKYIESQSWFKWIKREKLNTHDLMNNLEKVLDYEHLDRNIWIVKTNVNIYYPGTLTLIDTILRFLEFGDRKYPGIGIINKINKEYNYEKINNIWKLFLLSSYGIGITDSELIID